MTYLINLNINIFNYFHSHYPNKFKKMTLCPRCSKNFQENEIALLPNCGHGFCRICASEILHSLPQCPLCSLVETTNKIQNLPIPSNQQPISLGPQRSQSRGKAKNSTTKVNEVTDQCGYLQYVLEALMRKAQEQEKVLAKATEDIENNCCLIVNQLNAVKSIQLDLISKIKDENEAYAKKMYDEITGLIARRQEIKNRIGQGFVSNAIVSNQDMKEFAAFDYPKFDFKFTTVMTNFSETKVTRRVKKALGILDINWELKDMKYSNNTAYKRYRERVLGC